MIVIKQFVAILFLAFSFAVSAQTDALNNLSPDDGIAALKAGDEAGLEVISRKELEGVRSGPLNPELNNTALKEPSLDVFMQTEIAKKFPDEFSRQAWMFYHRVKN